VKYTSSRSSEPVMRLD